MKNSSPQFSCPKKCLVVMPDFIGDVILLIPFLKNLKINMSKSSYLAVVLKKSIMNLLDGMNIVDDLLDKKELTSVSYEFLEAMKFDTIIVLDFSLKWSVSSYLAQVKQRVIPDLIRSGLKNSWLLQKFFTHVLSNTAINETTPQKDVYLSFLTQLGLQIFDEDIKINISADEKQQAKKLLVKTDKPLAFIHTSASFFSKRWSLENWEKVVEYLSDKFEIYWIGEKNKSENSYFRQYLINDIRGKTTLKQTVCLLSQADLLISTDSAPAHLGAMVDVKNIVVLYGPTNHNQWKPCSKTSRITQVYLDLPCRPCQMRCCPSLACIKKLSAEKVIKAIGA